MVKTAFSPHRRRRLSHSLRVKPGYRYLRLEDGRVVLILDGGMVDAACELGGKLSDVDPPARLG